LDLRARVAAYVEAGHSRRRAAAHFSVSPSFVINLMRALGERGELAPKPRGGRRLRRVAEKDDITMPELAADLLTQSGVKADPASLSHWLIRNGLSFKKTFRPANAIGRTCAKRAKNGRMSGSPQCVESRIAWSSSMRRGPTRR
jgi:transposase